MFNYKTLPRAVNERTSQRRKERRNLLRAHTHVAEIYLIRDDGRREATDARFSLTIFPSISRAGYASKRGRNRVHAKPRYFRQKTTLPGWRALQLDPENLGPRRGFKGTGANRVVVYREISTLTSFRRPRNSFRRSLSPCS